MAQNSRRCLAFTGQRNDTSPTRRQTLAGYLQEDNERNNPHIIIVLNNCREVNHKPVEVSHKPVEVSHRPVPDFLFSSSFIPGPLGAG